MTDSMVARKKQVLADMTVVLAMAEKSGMFVPASYVYLALDSDMRRYTLAADMCKHMGWVELTGETVKLTKAGRELLAEDSKKPV